MDENVLKSADRDENAENKVAPTPPASLHLKAKRATASFGSFGATASCETFGPRSSISARKLRTIVRAPVPKG
jgi:hypothetical protein